MNRWEQACGQQAQSTQIWPAIAATRRRYRERTAAPSIARLRETCRARDEDARSVGCTARGTEVRSNYAQSDPHGVRAAVKWREARCEEIVAQDSGPAFKMPRQRTRTPGISR